MTETRPTRILVIDDEITQRMLVKEYLEEAGYQVRLSENGEHGLKLANAVAPDLIIVDALLPSLDGYTVCATIRERPKTADIPVILMTGSKEADAIAKGLAAGATDFITKPVEWRFLADRIAHVLEKSKSLRQLHAEKFFVEQELRLTHEKEGQQLPTGSEIESAKAALEQESQDVRAKAEEQIRTAQAAADAAIEASKAAHAEEIRAVRTAAAAEIQAAREAAAQEARSLWSFVATINSEQLGLARSILDNAEEAIGSLGEPARPGLREHLTVLHTQAKSLITLAHNVNIFAQSLSAKAPLVETEFDPEVQIGIIMARVGAACAERGLAMRATVAPDCPRLFADELKVGFVLLNAISNAIRFTPVGGTLSFDVGLQADGWLAVSLSDNGLGMPPAVVERLRNCLEHPGEIAGIHGGPIGLGLPTAMSIARLHGGRLEFASSVGQGTTVSLLMPPQRLRPAAARSSDGAASERRSA